MKREDMNDLYIERMYLLGRALLKYFNGLEITDEEAYMISNCQDKDIMPAIRMVQLNNANQNSREYLENFNQAIRPSGYIY